MLIQGTSEFTRDRTDEIMNPHTVFEVLSKSMEARDRGKKFHLYRSLPSLQNNVYGDLDDEVVLGGAIALPVAQVYRNIQFEGDR